VTEPGAPAEPAAPARERSPWVDVVKWPLTGGMGGGVVLLVLAALGTAVLEGGSTASEQSVRAYGRFACFAAAFVVLAVYARRAVLCTWPEERRPPWGRDSRDETPWTKVVSNFGVVVVATFAPLLAWLVLRGPLEVRGVVDWLVLALTAAVGAALFPLALAGSMAQDTVLAALPGPVLRMARADPHAAWIAALAMFVCTGLVLLSALLAALLVKQPSATTFAGESVRVRAAAPVIVPTWLVLLLFVLRAIAFYAALVAARVAGLLLREVPAMRPLGATR
jgi:hypothetical protein